MSAWAQMATVRLRRTTPRERALLALLSLSALVYAPVAAIGWRGEQEDLYVDAMTERSATRLARNSAQRVQAAASDTAAIDDMRTWGFEGSNPAILRVRIEQRLREAATRAGLENLKIEFGNEIETLGPTQWVTAQIQADLRWTPTFAFLDTLTGWPEGFRVTGFGYDMAPSAPAIQGFVSNNPDLIAQQATGRVRMALSFPVETPPQPAEDAQS